MRFDKRWGIFLVAGLVLVQPVFTGSAKDEPSVREADGASASPQLDLPNLPYDAFDQSPGKGWRALSDKKQFRDAAVLIEAYLEKRSSLSQREQANLHFHAAQCWAYSSDEASTQKSLAHLKNSQVHPEPPDSPVKWNDYVIATEAFLRRDLDALKAARAKIAQGPKLDGEIPNLNIVDRLIARFDKPFAEAYGGKN